MGLLDIISGAINQKNPHSDRKAACPKCNTELTLGMDRCPKCGTHVSSLFRIECPKCKTPNEIDANSCVKCGYDLSEKKQTGGGQEQYRCPLCGYVANYYMLSCPSCGVKFI